MRPTRRPLLRDPAIMLEMACHSAMGIVLGLSVAIALSCVESFGIAPLIAHSLDPEMMFAVFLTTFTLAFAVGMTLTGFVFTMMEER